jgi:hypothetical protein
MNKSKLIEALHHWINQRPGLEPGNYISGWDDAAGRSESRSITRDAHDARYLLNYVAIRDSITAEQILDAAKHNFSGRLSIEPKGEGFEVDYCTGQYWPTEYRKAAAAVLRGAIWDWLREGRTEADAVRKAARREFPASIARRWFN